MKGLGMHVSYVGRIFHLVVEGDPGMLAQEPSCFICRNRRGEVWIPGGAQAVESLCERVHAGLMADGWLHAAGMSRSWRREGQ